MTIESFFGVFEQRAKQFRKSLKAELAKTKKERRKDLIKGWIKEIKDLENLVGDSDFKAKCPNCGHRFNP